VYSTDEPVTFDRPPSVVRTVKISRERPFWLYFRGSNSTQSGQNRERVKSGEVKCDRFICSLTEEILRAALDRCIEVKAAPGVAYLAGGVVLSSGAATTCL
jgi:hypothetical protein